VNGNHHENLICHEILLSLILLVQNSYSQLTADGRSFHCALCITL